jgi:glycosyltransferase involved in cell wall biosynthesis
VLSISPRPSEVFDGLGDFSAGLAAALTALGTPASAISREDIGSWAALPAPDGRAIILHYVPQQFATADFAALIRWLRVARAGGAPLVVVIHEYMPPRDTLRRRLASVLFGWMLRRLLKQATAAVVTSDIAKRELSAMGFTPAPSVIPTASNIVRFDSDALPRADARWVLFGQAAMFSPALMRALGERAAHGVAIDIVWMTRSAAEARAYCARQGIDAAAFDIREGYGAAQVSAMLRSAAGALAPIDDGVSTRRSSVAAALAHALPIVGVDGACTSEAFRRSSACRLAGAQDPATFLGHLRDVSADGVARAAMSAAAVDLYDSLFAWPRIAAQYQSLIEAGTTPGARG